MQYREICLVCGGTIAVTPYDNHPAHKSTMGSLALVADEIYVDHNLDAGVTNFSGGSCNLTNSSDCPYGLTCTTLGGQERCRTSSNVTARGAGYQPVLCGDGPGPYTASGGRGGCALRDSGGGGGHFGVRRPRDQGLPRRGLHLPPRLGGGLRQLAQRRRHRLHRHHRAAATTTASRRSPGCPTATRSMRSSSAPPAATRAAATATASPRCTTSRAACGGRIVLAAVIAAQTGHDEHRAAR